MQVIAEHLSVDEVAGIKEAFDMMDTNKRGKTSSYGIEVHKSWSKGPASPTTDMLAIQMVCPWLDITWRSCVTSHGMGGRHLPPTWGSNIEGIFPEKSYSEGINLGSKPNSLAAQEGNILYKGKDPKEKWYAQPHLSFLTVMKLLLSVHWLKHSSAFFSTLSGQRLLFVVSAGATGNRLHLFSQPKPFIIFIFLWLADRRYEVRADYNKKCCSWKKLECIYLFMLAFYVTYFIYYFQFSLPFA